ncbi:unnamed protein product [Arabis nemorensis]|uniref:Jacalin-type lectin domain-containing protein n=1 Tax=Arabis nemorensis TaxID=586526 RepID=A0A565CTG3_9BRAS|nr:unnamed protein product [Arabis nemorensis]
MDRTTNLEDNRKVLGDEHGWRRTFLDTTRKFTLPRDENLTAIEVNMIDVVTETMKAYFTSMDVHLDDLEFGSRALTDKPEALTFRRFKTNKGMIGMLGKEEESRRYESTRVVLGKEGHKIVGFFGRSFKHLEQIGIYVKAIN